MLYLTLSVPVLAIASILAGVVYGATSDFHHQSQST
jgi:hypothetical protein